MCWVGRLVLWCHAYSEGLAVVASRTTSCNAGVIHRKRCNKPTYNGTTRQMAFLACQICWQVSARLGYRLYPGKALGIVAGCATSGNARMFHNTGTSAISSVANGTSLCRRQMACWYSSRARTEESDC